MNVDFKESSSTERGEDQTKNKHPREDTSGSSILLYEGQATISRKKNAEEKEAEPTGDLIQVEGKLRITQNLSPPRLRWECIAAGNRKLGFEEVDVLSDYSFKGKVNGHLKEGISGYVVDGIIERGGDHDLNKVLFLLPGWPSLLNVNFVWGDFRIGLSKNPDFAPDPSEPFSRDDIRFTGIGVIERADGGSFKKNTVEEVIKGLESFLSFAFNAWCPAMDIIGSSSKCEVSWECWRDSRISMRRQSRGWFNEYQPTTELENALPSFIRLWETPGWNQHLDLVLDRLVETSNNCQSAPAAVVLSQIPIELLSHLVICEKHHLLTSSDYEKLDTAGRFRLLAAFLGIPNEVPAELGNLTKLIEVDRHSNESIKDAPALLVNIRNSIIHPKDTIKARCEKKGLSLGSVQWEAAMLYWWYINLILLSVMNFSGAYAKRLTHYPLVDEIVQVPWSEGEPGSST